MPATAGRVRMPANNRVHSSAALQTHGIWQSAIGYDPYAPNKDDSKNSAQPKPSSNEPDADNPYNSYQGLLALARITNTNADEARGACKKCGRVGHLTFQCRNFLSVKADKEKDPEAIQAAVLSELEKIKGKVGKLNGKDKVESENDSDENEESDSSDSDADSEMERIIAARFGKKVSNKGRLSKKKKRDDSDENISDSDSGNRKKRGRSKKRRSGKRVYSDSDNEDESKRKRRREKRRKRDESSYEEDERQQRRRKSRKEKRRRRSHRYADGSDSSTSEDFGGRYERRSRRSATPSDFDGSGSDDSRVGRGAKRCNKKSRKRGHREYE